MLHPGKPIQTNKGEAERYIATSVQHFSTNIQNHIWSYVKLLNHVKPN